MFVNSDAYYFSLKNVSLTHTMKSRFLPAGVFLLAIVNIVLFWPGNLYFLNDDLLHIPLTDQGQLFQTNSVRPIHELLVRLDLFLWGKRAFGYHLTALVLHFIVCLQVYELSLTMQTKWLQINKKQAGWAALLALFLFLAYPQSSESLAWILGRTPVLSVIFLLITIRLFFSANISLLTYFTAIFFYGTNLFTYEQSVLLPLALLLIAITEKIRAKRISMIIFVSLLLLVDVVYVVVRKLITAEVVGNYEGGNLIRMNFQTLVANACRLLFRLVLNPEPKTLFLFSACVLILLIGFVIFYYRRLKCNRKAILFFLTAIVLLLAPVISLGLAVNSFESGRYLYLPSIFFIIGISIAATSILQANQKRLKVPVFVLFILVTVYWLKGKVEASQSYTAASSYAQRMELQIQHHFQTSSDTLFIDTLRVTVNRLPVFRRGFNTGINWLNNHSDTNKIVVKNYYDEVTHRDLQ